MFTKLANTVADDFIRAVNEIGLFNYRFDSVSGHHNPFKDAVPLFNNEMYPIVMGELQNQIIKIPKTAYKPIAWLPELAIPEFYAMPKAHTSKHLTYSGLEDNPDKKVQNAAMFAVMRIFQAHGARPIAYYALAKHLKCPYHIKFVLWAGIEQLPLDNLSGIESAYPNYAKRYNNWTTTKKYERAIPAPTPTPA